MGRRGYLTKKDKVVIVVSLAVLVPLATIGYRYFALGIVALGLVTLVVLALRLVVELIAGPRRRKPTSGSEAPGQRSRRSRNRVLASR